MAEMGNVRLAFLLVVFTVWICEAASGFQPISDSHRSAALELFTPVDGSYPSLEETYKALRTFEVLNIEKKSVTSPITCESVSKTLGSSSSTLRDLFYGLKVNGLASCKIDEAIYEGIVPRLHAAIKDANSLLDFYYSVGSLVLVKDQTSRTDLYVDGAEGIFRSIKTLSQSDGRWRYSSNNPESSTLATGLAYETLAGVISLAPADIDQSLVRSLKNDIRKLFDIIEKYDDESFFFAEKTHAIEGPVSTTASIIKGLSALAAVIPKSLNLPEDKVLGLAKFFLSIGVPEDSKDFFYQVEALACLEDDRFFIPLILSLPSTVISLTKKEPLKVRVSTVLGSNAPGLTVKLVQAFSSKDSSVIESQDLKFNPENEIHFLDSFPKSLDVGKYTLVFEIVLHESENGKPYTTGAQTKVPVFITGHISIDDAEFAILESDLGTVESQKMDLTKDGVISLSANHLQKLRLSFQLTTPVGRVFKPHQAFLKLKHETGVEHIFLVGSSRKKFEIVLDFLGLVEKFYYLSGKYDLQLTLGDAAMENSLLSNIGHIELDLPERPEKASRPPLQPVDLHSRYGPKAEISHIFRAPEKRPPSNLSFAFLGLSLLPLLGFLVGLMKLGVNLKNFPSSACPSIFAILFHCGIGAVLSLYALFWLKLDLFTTLKALGFLGVFLVVVGHRILSHLSAASNKLKSA